jgi:hypothetical protein
MAEIAAEIQKPGGHRSQQRDNRQGGFFHFQFPWAMRITTWAYS